MGAQVEGGGGEPLTEAPDARRWWALAVLSIVAVAYVALRVHGFAGVQTLTYRDSESYLLVAGQSLASADFWAGGRPWTVPLLYKLVGGSDEARVIAQLVVSIACWLALAVVVARIVRPRAAGLVAFAAVLAFSLTFAVIRWDRLILSESVSISLTAAVIAAWLALAHRPSPRAVIVLAGVNVLWVFTRDSNALLAALTALPALVWAVRPGPIGRGWPLALAGALLATFAANLAATGAEEAKLRRQERPMMHVIGRRVLVHPEQEAWFRAHGMPEPTPLVRRERKALAAIGDTIPSDERTDAFLEWVRDHGRRALAVYLVTHPKRTLAPIVSNRRRLLRGVTIGYRSPDARQVLPKRASGLVYPDRVRSVQRWLAFTAVLTALVAWLAGARREWLVAIAAIALQLPHAILVYHGDTLEVARHAVVMAITLRLGILLLALLAAARLGQWALQRRTSRRPPASAPSTDVRLPA